ncbi:MAG: YaaR family protein [Treponema sp.]|nr:YaaR family protein [Treponema sp.]MCL2237816.1 YaaR family protein [Treponema sp.]
MAKIDGTDPSLFMNPSAYSQVKDDKKSKGIRKGEKTEFSKLFDSLRSKTAEQLGPLQDLPASEETVNYLMDEVRDAGDRLKSRPLPEEIMNYKQAVRNFINYVVQNCYSKEYDEGIPNFLKPGFKGRRGTPQAMEGKGYTKIVVIDKKLEDLAAMLLSGQTRQMELVSRLEEIKGLLIDLLQ